MTSSNDTTPRPVLEVLATNQEFEEDDRIDGQYSITATQNFRKAFAVVGTLIVNGFVQVDFRDNDWSNDFKVMIAVITESLNHSS
jgi:hypothetical protein